MGNVLALLDMMARRDDTFHEHLENGSRNSQYTSKTVQNEVIDVIAEYLQLKLKTCLDADDAFFAIMADEVIDPHGNQETLSVCLRILDDIKVDEVFFYFVYLERATGHAIAYVLIICLQRNNVDITKRRAQSYGGASCMSSERVGIQGLTL